MYLFTTYNLNHTYSQLSFYRRLEDGDIVNVDVTVYYKGVHGESTLNPLNFLLVYAVNISLSSFDFIGDLNETFFVGEVDEASQHLVRCTYECLEKAISIGYPFNIH